MSIQEINQIQGMFGLLGAVAMVVFVLAGLVILLFKRKTNLNVNRKMTAEEIYNILKAVPGHVFNQRVKRVELLNPNAVGLFCSLININITQKGEKWTFKSRLNGVVRTIYLVIIGLCIVSGALAGLLRITKHGKDTRNIHT